MVIVIYLLKGCALQGCSHFPCRNRSLLPSIVLSLQLCLKIRDSCSKLIRVVKMKNTVNMIVIVVKLIIILFVNTIKYNWGNLQSQDSSSSSVKKGSSSEPVSWFVS